MDAFCIAEVIDMKKMALVVGLLVLALVTAGIVAAHGAQEGQHYGEREMRGEIKDVLESGTYEDLEALRDRYNRPFMHWVDSSEDFANAQSGPQNCPMWQ